ncbi:hypothetical protein ACE1SV_73360 [Streptomyces sp. E-15]
MRAAWPPALSPFCPSSPPQSPPRPLAEAVDSLTVVAEDRTGYDREEAFGNWIDADCDGCDTRAEVLLADAVEEPTVTGRCTLTGGRCWPSSPLPHAARPRTRGRLPSTTVPAACRTWATG